MLLRSTWERRSDNRMQVLIQLGVVRIAWMRGSLQLLRIIQSWSYSDTERYIMERNQRYH